MPSAGRQVVRRRADRNRLDDGVCVGIDHRDGVVVVVGDIGPAAAAPVTATSTGLVPTVMVVCGALATVTLTGAPEVVVLPAASRARAVSVWVPLVTVVVSHDTL